jgi:hypothetical protein
MTLRVYLPHVCGIAQSARQARLLFMLKAFFDEASDNTQDFLMAGWLARFDEWESFSTAWAKELEFSPSVEYFNHNEAMGNKCQFEGWSDADRDSKMIALAGVIARYKLIGLVGKINILQLDALFSHSVAPRRQLRTTVKFTEPYHHACQCVVAVTLGYQVLKAKNLNDPVDFIFDEGVRYLADIVGNYPRLKAILPAEAQKIAGTIVPGNDKQIVALQAADFLAGQELLELRIKTKPQPLALIDDGRINRFSCHGKALKTIPSSVSQLNIIWSTKNLRKSKNERNARLNMKTKRKSEFERFDATMRELLAVSHDEIKAKQDAEKAEKKQKKAKKKNG